ncbi:MAG: transposase [Actinomycetota bacterium]
MAYPERQQFPGAMYHIMSRGNGKQKIFLGERDRRKFLKILCQVTAEYRWLVLAYCLMGNHYHMLLETPEPNLADGMLKLNGAYGKWFNYVHERVGHVMQGRYRSRLVVEEGHFIWLTRYIVLNPVRSGFVDRPEQWFWSSYAFTIGQSNKHPFLSPVRVLDAYGETREKAIEEYVKDVEAALEESREIAREKSMSLKQILGGDNGRPSDERICKAYYDHHYRLSELSTVTGMSRSTVSRIVRRSPRRNY